MGVHVKVGGTWREVTEVAVKEGGTWRREATVHVKSGGVWRNCGPIYQVTDQWFATWSQSYQGNNSKRDDTNGQTYLYQGWSTVWGYTKGAIGFDYADIQATLAGRTIVSAGFGITNLHHYYSTGNYLVVGTHDHASEPTTFAFVHEFNHANYGLQSGPWNRYYSLFITNSTPGTPPYSWAEALQAGTIKGLAVGFSSYTQSSYFWGYHAGATDPNNPPDITITHSP